MKRFRLPGHLLLLSLLACISTLSARRPNVIIIFTDDQGTVDMNCYGAKDLVTPNMDGLAKRGVRFTQFYSAAPVCSPSRVGLMTGRTPQHGGLNGNVPLDSVGMPSQQITIAEKMKTAGYATAHIGKWHLGHHKETGPKCPRLSITPLVTSSAVSITIRTSSTGAGLTSMTFGVMAKRSFIMVNSFPDLMVKEAGEFIDKNKDQPFFIYFALNTPHYPYQGSPKWLEHYRDLPYPRNLYAAFLSTTDDRIGALLSEIENAGLTNDTIIIFQSDHGASEEVRAHKGGGSAGPHRGAKFSLYEGGIRVPAIISWPGNLPQNEGTESNRHRLRLVPNHHGAL
jgi:arylsulfatase A-like enzyme